MKIYTDNIRGFKVIGYHGGANGNFLGIIFVNPSTNQIYSADVNSIGKIYFTKKEETPIRKYPRDPIYNIIGSTIVSVEEGYPAGNYFGFTLKGDKTYIAQGEYGGHIIQIQPLGKPHISYEEPALDYADMLELQNTRKKKPSSKPKRKPIKCSCKKK